MAAELKKNKEQMFEWVGLDKRGTNVRGEQLGTSIALIKARLRSQGITPLKVKKKSKALFGKTGKKKITANDICVFSRQLATMIQSGVPLMQAIEIISTGHDNPSMRLLTTTIKTDIESGLSLAEAIKRHPRHFDELYCNLVEAGELSGTLEQMMERIASYKEKSESLKRKIKKALFYPSAVLVVAIIVSAILLIFVVPQFDELFKSFGADLPAFTRMVINLSEFTQQYWYLILLAIIAFGFLIKEMHFRSEKFRQLTDKYILKLPVIGNILHKAAIARYARTLSTTFSAGVPLIEALNSVAKATGNVIYRDAVLHIKEAVSTGSQMQVAMRETQVFPNMVIQMVAIGEESGSLDSMLEKVASIHEEEVDLAVDGLSSLLEPLIMAILGVLVGGLVVAMYLPIFKMGSVI